MAKERRIRLNEQQAQFVSEYMLSWNATEAAEKAGYAMTHGSTGHRLLHTPAVLDELRQRCLKTQRRLELNADDIRRGFANIACDPRTVEEGGPTFDNRISALRELGKLMGLYIAKVHVTGTLTLEDLLLQADKQKRAELPAAGMH